MASCGHAMDCIYLTSNFNRGCQPASNFLFDQTLPWIIATHPLRKGLILQTLKPQQLHCAQDTCKCDTSRCCSKLLIRCESSANY